MLSILEQIGMKSPPSTAKKTRQMTLETAFSRVNNRKTPSSSKDASSTPPSMTTGTSNADNSSELNDDINKLDDNLASSARARSSAGSYHERSRPGMSLSPQKHKHGRGSRDVSGLTTLVDVNGDSSEQILQRSVQALDEDWDVGAMPGDDLQLSTRKTSKFNVQKRESTRLDILNRASTAVEKTKSVLGKRARETIESGKEQAAALYGMTSSRLRCREAKSQTLSFEGPVSKKTRFLEAIKKEATPEPVYQKKKAKKLTKTWIDHGLYVGQDRDSDPRLTEAQNKKKSANKSSERKPFMPLPMYSGQKALEQGRNFRLPFEVFSPLPPGQPKPDEWKKVQKNVFIGEASSVWKKAKKLEDSVCDCTAENGCDEQCYNRFMLYECDDNNCNIGKERCTNRSFADLKERLKAGGKYNVGVEVLKTVDRGYGIRANRSFAPNQIIVEYTGEIITKEECDSRMHGCYKDAECYYLMDFDQSMILDATRGSIARFVNHSCSPNCRMAKWTVGGKPRMALFAGDNGIITGEELTYDYNFNPFSVKNIQECRCGADNCRGVLGPKPKEAKEREIREALKPIARGGGKRKIQQMADDAIDGMKNAAKKQKLNFPGAMSVKNAMMKAQIGIQGQSQGQSQGKPKPKPKPKPQLQAQKKEKEKPKKGAKPKLPIGWVYTAELEEPPPPIVRNIFATDPEALLRSQKRKLKQESEEAFGMAQRNTKRKTTAGLETLSEQPNNTPGRPTSEKFKAEPHVEEGQQSISRRDGVKAKASSVKKNIVRTMKGRGVGNTPGTSGAKSILVIDDGDDDDGVEEEVGGEAEREAEREVEREVGREVDREVEREVEKEVEREVEVEEEVEREFDVNVGLGIE